MPIKSFLYLILERSPNFLFILAIKSLYSIKGIGPVEIKQFNKYYSIKHKSQHLFLQSKERFRLFLSGIDERQHRLAQEYCLSHTNISIDPRNKEYSDNLFVDVGANIAEFSLWCSKNSINKYVGFEPDPAIHKLASENIRNVNCTYELNHELHQIALSNYNGECNFYLSEDSADSSTINSFYAEKSILINCAKADDFFNQNYGEIPRPYIYKVEAEGAEEQVLLGSTELIRNSLYLTLDGGPENYGQITLPECLNLILSVSNHEIIDINMSRGTCLLRKKYEN